MRLEMMLMLFHEVYGCYYHCVGEMINLAIDNKLTNENMLSIIHQYAFEESHLHIIPSLNEKKWQIFDKPFHTPLQHHYSLPLTLLEKRWLKTISLDPKIKLFSLDFPDLDNIQPLFTQDDYVIYDQYQDGDPYDDDSYQEIFQLSLKAIRYKKAMKVHYLEKEMICIPYHIEYSLKDDKFRLYVIHQNKKKILNIHKIKSIELLNEYSQDISIFPPSKKYFVLNIYDERNALERVMTHFADLQKQAEQIDKNNYKVKIYYETQDETEMIIRVLSFGPLIKVIEPDSFVKQIKDRLIMQKVCNLK